MFKNIIFIFSLLIFTPLFSRSIFIIIHGTWSLETTWYMPGGDFFDALEKTAQESDACVVPFSWNGKNSIDGRQKAAQNLAKLIETYNADSNIILVGHSHGGTVALLASHLLQKNKIFCLYTLGTPINPSIYPNMDTIEYCYNLFSFEDLIQPVLGMFKREHVPHKRIANIRVIINDKEPDHTDLHHKIIGQWLPHLHTIIKNADFAMIEPGIIHFTNTTVPIYYKDIHRKELLDRDYRLLCLILNSLPKKYIVTKA